MLDSYLYHCVPSGFRGKLLLPLNRFREVWPEIYAQAARKYEGRQSLMQATVPLLECLWNDVVHLSPIPPHAVAKALRNAGDRRPFKQEWFKIPADALSGIPAITLESRSQMYIEGAYQFDSRYARPFEVAAYRELEEVPEWTQAYYLEEITQGRRPLLFNGVMHVLAQGAVSVERAEIIAWEDDRVR